MNNRQIDAAAPAGADVQKINKEELTDVNGLVLDPGVPRELRSGYILRAAGSPYCFRAGDLGVKLEFLNGAPPLQDILSDFLRRKKGGCHGTETSGEW